MPPLPNGRTLIARTHHLGFTRLSTTPTHPWHPRSTPPTTHRRNAARDLKLHSTLDRQPQLPRPASSFHPSARLRGATATHRPHEGPRRYHPTPIPHASTHFASRSGTLRPARPPSDLHGYLPLLRYRYRSNELVSRSPFPSTDTACAHRAVLHCMVVQRYLIPGLNCNWAGPANIYREVSRERVRLDRVALRGEG